MKKCEKVPKRFCPLVVAVKTAAATAETRAILVPAIPIAFGKLLHPDSRSGSSGVWTTMDRLAASGRLSVLQCRC